jgi:hypothetical protein
MAKLSPVATQSAVNTDRVEPQKEQLKSLLLITALCNTIGGVERLERPSGGV